ncbi:MAG TPA: phosphoribosylamine--glycine ligase [Streptosporangiaceae bacterium]
MRVLVIGTGGREHALCRALAADPAVTGLHVAPGNPGMAAHAARHEVDSADPAAIGALARRLAPGLVVIGPETPLVAGVADVLAAAGIPCFGPVRDAAMIEGSKSFAKDVMAAAGIPTAAAVTARTPAEAAAALDRFGPPYVVKADGLAAGKGVLVTTDRAAALAHAAAAAPVVIEEYLDGPEVSVFALADGEHAVPLLPAQDFKRAHDGDAGPNTGGMGAYTPLPWAPDGLAGQVLATVIQPALCELRRRGTPYQGVLYAGLALTAAGPRVVEFNARFGDPEIQVVLDRLASPLAGLLAAAAVPGGLAGAGPLSWHPGSAVTVVLAAGGYPGTSARGDEITGLDAAAAEPGAYVLQANTTLADGGTLVSAGGRVLNVVGTGPDLAAARDTAYRAVARIGMRGGWYRHDIAAAAAARS